MAVSSATMLQHLLDGMRDPDSNWARLMRGEELPAEAEIKEPSRWDPRPDGRNVAHQHIPGYVTGYEPEDVPFDTVDELLALPFVARWTERPRFYRFSLSPAQYPSLMAEMDHGLVWWVVATLDRAVQDLPLWEARR